jgi:hypothetical protein
VEGRELREEEWKDGREGREVKFLPVSRCQLHVVMFPTMSHGYRVLPPLKITRGILLRGETKIRG